jgi:CDP-diacylglycerol--glycerol-3-phosphate 3-phosphatidyltransferase
MDTTSTLKWKTWANALSVLRLAIALPCAYAIWRGQWTAAGALFVVAVATDVLDGIVARRRNEASTLGGLLDHSIDAAFVTITLAALAMIGAAPIPLPALAITAFAQYVWDSKALTGAPLRASVLGRWNGIGYYALVGTATLKRTLGADWLPDEVVLAAGWLLVATTLASMTDRALALWRIRRAR